MSQQQDQNTQTEKTSGWYGPFYYNRNDARVFLRKRWGWGWTLNFASTWSYVLLFGPAVVAVAAVVIVRSFAH